MHYLNVAILNKVKYPDNIDYKYVYAVIQPQTNVLLISGLFRGAVYFKSYTLDPTRFNKLPIHNTEIYKTFLQIDLTNDIITSYTTINIIDVNTAYIYIALYEYNKHLFPSYCSIYSELTNCCI